MRINLTARAGQNTTVRGELNLSSVSVQSLSRIRSATLWFAAHLEYLY